MVGLFFVLCARSHYYSILIVLSLSLFRNVLLGNLIESLIFQKEKAVAPLLEGPPALEASSLELVLQVLQPQR